MSLVVNIVNNRIIFKEAMEKHPNSPKEGLATHNKLMFYIRNFFAKCGFCSEVFKYEAIDSSDCKVKTFYINRNSFDKWFNIYVVNLKLNFDNKTEQALVQKGITDVMEKVKELKKPLEDPVLEENQNNNNLVIDEESIMEQVE